MHEFGYCEAILEAVTQRARGRPVDRVTVRIGARHRIEGPSLDQAFAMVASGTVAEGAAVDLVILPIRATCRGCDARWETTDAFSACQACGETDLELEGGQECLLESIRLRDPA